MFNRKRVNYSKGMALLDDFDKWRLMDGCTDVKVGKDKTTLFYVSEDHAVRASRLLMNRNVPYVQRG